MLPVKYMFEVNNRKKRKKLTYLIQVNNKDIQATSVWRLLVILSKVYISRFIFTLNMYLPDRKINLKLQKFDIFKKKKRSAWCFEVFIMRIALVSSYPFQKREKNIVLI